MALADDLDCILWTEDQIADRVAELASQISGDFKHLSPPPVVVGVATGAFVFLADIVRKITLPVVVDFIRVESYGPGTESSGTPRISSDIKVDVSEKHVILVEDIVDTGNTLSCLIPHLEKKGASSVSVCTFLDKPARRRVLFQLVGDGKFYNGFECPDEFVVGYGMDFAERYRNLPCVGVLQQEIYKGCRLHPLISGGPHQRLRGFRLWRPLLPSQPSIQAVNINLSSKLGVEAWNSSIEMSNDRRLEMKEAPGDAMKATSTVEY